MYKQSVDIWFTFYRFHTKQEYVFNAKDGLHMKQILTKIKTKLKQNEIPQTDENIIAALKQFLNTVKDPWILSHLEVSIINSKFNVLYQSAAEKQQSSIRSIIARRRGDHSATAG